MSRQALSYLIPLLVLLPLLYWRFRKMMKPQRLKLSRLMLRPALMLFAAGGLLASTPPSLADLSWLVAAALLGGAGGWYWGKFTNLHLHAEDGTVMAVGSQAGMIALVVLILLRMGLRAGMAWESQALHVNPALLADGLIIFTVALFSVQGLEIFLRSRRLMRAKA